MSELERTSHMDADASIEQKAVNTIRVLAAEMIEKAKSGHPGAPLGTAPMLYLLYGKHLKIHPTKSRWHNRDRFVLSGGHGSAGLYATLHLLDNSEDKFLPMEQLKKFRQMDSITPGHPEFSVTPHVEATTGPLGSGFAAAVGMAAAEKHLATMFNRPGYPVIDHYTFVEAGDGDIMEGIFQEAASLAGTWKLNKLIVLYDSNNISIEGDTKKVLSENVRGRMEANGWNTILVEDGNDLEALDAAITLAKQSEKPTFIEVKTHIGYGSPKQDSASSHGEPLGEDNVKALKENLKYPYEEPFKVAPEIYNHFEETLKPRIEEYEKWEKMFEEWSEKYPELREIWDHLYAHTKYGDIFEDEELWEVPDKPEATRVSSGRILQKIKNRVPLLIGGAADLGPSTKTIMEGEGDFSAETPEGRNIHYGVREIAMAGITNGLALSGLRPYAATFFVFADYMKPMARLAALMHLPAIYIFTHDSIGVGEDGPTHQPVEHLVGYRTIPGLRVFRPADATETAAAWSHAISKGHTPTAMVLSRQNLPQIEGTSKEALKGAYIVAEAPSGNPEAIIIATGSELHPAKEAYDQLVKDGVEVRLVSMPCMELFEEEGDEYKEYVLPKHIKNRVAVEAQSDFSWGKYIGFDGETIALKDFGVSGPGEKLFKELGFTPENIKETVLRVIERNKQD